MNDWAFGALVLLFLFLPLFLISIRIERSRADKRPERPEPPETDVEINNL